MKFESKRTVESRTCEGVTFVVHKLTEGRRNRLRLKLADALAKLRTIQGEIDALPLPRTLEGDLDDKAELDPKVLAQVLVLQDRIQTITSVEIDPAYVDACFVSVAGVEIDGKSGADVDATLLRESGPEELYREIVAVVRAEAELTGTERKNSESPTTLDVAAGGGEKSTTAEFADATSCT